MRASSVGVRIALVTLFVAGALSGATCPERAEFYETNHYLVRRVRIQTPLDVLGVVRRQFLPVEQSLPLQAGARFTRAAQSRSFGRVRDAFGEQNIAAGERIRLSIVVPEIENCDDAGGAPALDVVFRIYATDSVFAMARVFEGRFDRATRALAPGAVAKDQGQVLPQPFVGFNAERGFFGGTAASFKQESKIVQRVDTAVAVGNGSLATNFALSGMHSFPSGFLNFVDWRAGHRYSDLPAGSAELKADATASSLRSVRSAIGFGQVSAASNPRGDLGFVFRFGAALEGGNRSVAGDLTAGQPGSARYGAVKGYAGTTFNTGRQAFSSSYGVQFGSAGPDIGLDYVKHLLDVGHTGRILLTEHHPMRLETRFTAGAITNSGRPVPVAERFRGGNSVTDFIDGDGWRIRSAPMIRSFPENTLLRTADGAIGGTNFFSLNFTLGVTGYSYAAVPVEIGRDPDIRIALTGELGTAKQGTIVSYLEETPEFAVLSSRIQELETVLSAVAATANDVLSGSLSQPLRSRIEAFAATADQDDAVHEAIGVAGEAKKHFGSVRQLVLGFPSQGVVSLIEDLGAELGGVADDLKQSGLTKEETRFRELGGRLEDRRKAAVPEYDKVRSLTAMDANSLEGAKALLPGITTTIASTRAALAPFATATDAEVKLGLPRTTRYLDALDGAVLSAQAPDPQSAVSDFDRLATGTGEITEPLLLAVVRELHRLAKHLEAVKQDAAAKQLHELARAFDDEQRGLRRRVKAIPRPAVERKARRDLAYTGRILDVVFRELSLFSVSPVLLFDAARIGPQPGGRFGGTRYGVGGGIRFSVVSLDLTVGYSRNPGRKPWEPSGALFFSLDIADLFR